MCEWIYIEEWFRKCDTNLKIQNTASSVKSFHEFEDIISIFDGGFSAV